jgi:hypothetical protein
LFNFCNAVPSNRPANPVFESHAQIAVLFRNARWSDGTTKIVRNPNVDDNRKAFVDAKLGKMEQIQP